MTSKHVIRYYCDHCRRGMFRRPDMARHEAVCYRNPARQCWRCGNHQGHAVTDARKRELLVLAAAGDLIESAAGECPDCLMAHCIQQFRKRDPDETPVIYTKEQYVRDRGFWEAERSFRANNQC